MFMLDNHIFSEKFSLRKKCIVLFLLWLILSYLFPYSCDDWAWGSQIGIERLSTWFDNYGGRYFSNLIVLALTRQRFLRAFVMSLTFTGIAYCAERLLDRKWVSLLVTLSILLTSRLIIRQAVVWTSGFANYSVSVFLTLLFLVYLNDHFKEPSSFTLRDTLMLAALGAANCLIVEHFTLFNFQLSIVVVIAYIVKYHKMHWGFLSYSFGCIAGTLLMFSNSAYRSIADNRDGYRSVMRNGIIAQVLDNYFYVIYREAYFYNWFINAIVLICLIILLVRGIDEGTIAGFRQIISSILVSILLAYELYSIRYIILNGYDYELTSITTIEHFQGIFSAISLIAMVVLSIIVTGTHQLNFRLLFLWYSAMMIVLPLFGVNPIGSRCFFGTYIVFTLIMCELLASVYSSEAFNYRLCVSCTAALFVAFSVYIAGFSQIYRADNARLETVKKAVESGETAVEFHRLPHDEYLWISFPKQDNDVWETRYKLFYNIPEDFDLIINR